MLVHVQDSQGLIAALRSAEEEAIVGFFSKLSEAAVKARSEFERFCADHPDRSAYLVDVGLTREPAAHFGVTSVPTVLLIKGGRVLQKIVGLQQAAFYARALLGAAAVAPTPADGRARPSHRVIVYTTSTCPWCVRVKAYLRQNNVSFQEINVSRDERAAQRMVAKSGQQGVPQLDIDGSVVVGFDKARIDALLGLSGPTARA